MIRKFARFEVRTEALDEAKAAIAAFVDEVRRKEGGTATYRAFQERDAPTRFTHYMEFNAPAAEKYHQQTAWAKRFVATLHPLCSVEPALVDVEEVA